MRNKIDLFQEDKMKLIISILLTVLLIAGMVSAQDTELRDYGYRGMSNIFGIDPLYDFNSSGFGARSKAMGGVHFAFNNDGFSSFLNPATMIFTGKSLMSIDVINSTDKFQVEGFTGIFEVDGKHTSIIQAGAVAPFTYANREWWVGGGYRTVYDLCYGYTLPAHDIEINDTVYQTVNTELDNNRSIDALNMAIAASPIPELALGFNMNMYVRGYRSNGWLNISELDYVYDTVYTHTARASDKSNFTGLNFDLGALIDLDFVKAAFKITTPLTLTQKVQFTLADVDIWGQEDGFVNRLTAKNKFPATYGGGIAFTPMDNFTLAADVEYKPYSKVKIDVDPEILTFRDIIDYDPQWENLTQYRAGVEYVHDFGFASIPLRAGIQNLPGLKRTLSRVVDFTPDFTEWLEENYDIIVEDSLFYGDQPETYLYSFGTGIRFEKIWFDVAYQFGSSEYDRAAFEFYGYYPIEANRISNYYLSPVKLEYSRLYFSVGMLF
jgi:opacity protein-like surface antigen